MIHKKIKKRKRNPVPKDLRKSALNQSNLTMKEVFTDLPSGYWRTAERQVVKITEMNDNHLLACIKFLREKLRLQKWVLEDERPFWYDRDMDALVKYPAEWDYMMKIMEMITEAKERGLMGCDYEG